MKTLYETDFYAWSLEQAEHIKKREFSMLDLENLIDEIESLGRSPIRALESHFTVLIAHLLRKYNKPPYYNIESWNYLILESRMYIKCILKESPSVRNLISEIVSECYESSVRWAGYEEGIDERQYPKECPWTIEQILGE